MPYVVNISGSDDDDDDVEILDIRRETQELLANAPAVSLKRLADVQCPICFDNVTNATTTSCGHVFCLECIQQGISSSYARGQTRGRRGVGLCPLCRKRVTFKDTIVLRMRVGGSAGAPAVEK